MTPNFVLANDICFKNLTSARAGAAKIEYTQKQEKFWEDKYAVCNAERINLDGQTQTLNLTISGLTKDKEDLKQVAADYKKSYLDTNQALMKSEADKPSRLTWFGVGVITTAVLGLAGIFAVHK